MWEAKGVLLGRTHQGGSASQLATIWNQPPLKKKKTKNPKLLRLGPHFLAQGSESCFTLLSDKILHTGLSRGWGGCCPYQKKIFSAFSFFWSQIALWCRLLASDEHTNVTSDVRNLRVSFFICRCFCMLWSIAILRVTTSGLAGTVPYLTKCCKLLADLVCVSWHLTLSSLKLRNADSRAPLWSHGQFSVVLQ